MEIVKLKEPYDKNAIVDSPIVLALGFFDGVHRGHQEVIKRAIEKGKSVCQVGTVETIFLFETFNLLPQLIQFVSYLRNVVAHFFVTLIIHNILQIHIVSGLLPLNDTNCNSAKRTHPVLFFTF